VIFQSDLSFAPLDRMLFFILVFVGGKKTGRNSYELLLTSFFWLQKVMVKPQLTETEISAIYQYFLYSILCVSGILTASLTNTTVQIVT